MSDLPDLSAEAGAVETRATVIGLGFFEPNPAGTTTLLLMPVFDDRGSIIDLIGWESGRPGKWWHRIGGIDFLGAEEVARCRRTGRALRMVETPAGWLRDGGEACCWLDWSAPLLPVLGGLRLAPESDPLADTIEAAIHRETMEGAA